MPKKLIIHPRTKEANTELQWARKLGLTSSALHYRIKKWDLEKALDTPPDKQSQLRYDKDHKPKPRLKPKKHAKRGPYKKKAKPGAVIHTKPDERDNIVYDFKSMIWFGIGATCGFIGAVVILTFLAP